MRSATNAFEISDLRARPEFFDVIADRIWRAWWKDGGFPLTHITGLLRENLGANPVPTALAAHDGDLFLGAASLIASDLDERPELTPWVAAVWVEKTHRGRGVGAALTARTVDLAFTLGHERVYLCAAERMHDYYHARGWRRIEEAVGARSLGIYARDRAPA